MNTVSRLSSAGLLAFSLLMCSSANSQTAQQRFRDSSVEMPPGNLVESVKSVPGLLTRQPRETTMDYSRLILERMELLERKIELMELRLKQIEGGKK